MVLYGTKIFSDIDWRHQFAASGVYRQELSLECSVPDWAERLARRSYIQTTHRHETFLRTDPSDALWQPREYWAYEIAGLGVFFADRQKHRVLYQWEADPWQMEFWFAHLFMPLWLALESDALLLHASAVEIGNEAVIFCAPSYGGKSTLAHFLMQQGHRLITDDTIALFPKNGRFVTTGSVPYSRPYREFETLGEYVPNFLTQWCDAAHLYLLARGDDAMHQSRFIPLHGIARFTSLHKSSLIYNFPHLKIRQLRDTGTLFETAQVTHLERPWGKVYLPALYTEILNHLKRDR